MNKILYNILWIDDEHEQQDGIKCSALDSDLKLFPYKSLEAGMAELEKNFALYDGVLLDAKFFEKEDDVAGTEDTEFVERAKERILQLPKKFEIHILTGQAEAFESNHFNKSFKKVFGKGNDDDEDKLFQSLKCAAEKQDDFQIKCDFQRVFEICDDKYLGTKTYQPILNLLKLVISKNNFEPTKDSLLPVRKIIENSFDKLFDLGVIPKEILDTGLNKTVKFLCNNKSNSGFELNIEFMHPTLAYFFDNLLFIIQDSQHDTEGLKLNVDDYISKSKSPYLFKSLVFQFLDYLIWLKQFIDKNPNPLENSKLWNKKEILNSENITKGELKQDVNGNYHIGNNIFEYNKIHNKFDVGDQFEIIETIFNTASTKISYPNFIIKFQKIS